MSIPAKDIASVTPGVLSAGGSALALSGLILTNSTRVPIGQVLTFASPDAVGAYFGLGSLEASDATVYFLGFDNSNVKPGALLFAQYPWAAPVPAYLRGGSVASLTLAQLRALSSTGVITLTIDGLAHTSGAIDLSAATSFSNAATIIQTALAAFDAVVTGTIATTHLTVTAVASGSVQVGQTISGAGVTLATITGFESGTPGGVGVYGISVSQTVAAPVTIDCGPALVTYDSVSGAFVITGGTPGATHGSITVATGTAAVPLRLTTATGAVTSQGADIAVPGVAMSAILNVTKKFFSFSTTFEPVTADKEAFAAWNAGQADNYLYSYDETNIAATQPNDNTLALAEIIASTADGTVATYQPTYLHQSKMLQGFVASIDFAETQGRATMFGKHQEGMTPGVTDETIAGNLLANGYNFYGDYANSSNEWDLYNNGTVTGRFLWIDTYANQRWFSDRCQTAMMDLVTTAKSIPYNAAGRAMIESTLADPVNEALNNGVIQTGVELTAQQAQQINAAAGANIANTITTQGFYIQVKAGTPSVRQARTSPPITVWYTDGGSVQRLNLASIVIL